MKKTIALLLLVLAVLTAAGGYLAWHETASDELVFGTRADLPTLTFYTTGLATTPQLPFWSAVRNGKLLHYCNLRVRTWKSTDDLRGLLLAGKGDLWLGHVEGFYQAHQAGAPVQILTVSGWKKFYLLSRNPAVKKLADLNGRELPYAPAGSPAVPILEAVATNAENDIRYQPFEPKQLAMALLRGNVQTALAPEPLVTNLLTKVDGLRIVTSVEELYGQRTGSPARLPLAGVAVNRHTAERLPGVVEKLVEEMISASQRLESNPEEGIDARPKVFGQFVSRDTIKQSLSRDLILTRPANQIPEEIQAYLTTLNPEKSATTPATDELPVDLLWKP
ncbi:ABC transporter, periplasmic substrate-binding protein [Syntrophotalea carbinolica DSM 2380]|uniref:ABC transporter, periplasmic substrate-binding protein n=1 Tax=Syntrophotalea carbinolica (strain DSM 2380 / NBRC 103641 / GraBd1) TaxID=338963 RepID=Q3A695_SYNC1|nr:ABC transporter substrate-binding protein [Syntrophotalea carbinolica]ABA88112.1 ABC transporter, periplasmic substrate-binding protein [Syntrophotalea carbinolica DSM 2380]